MFADRKLGWKEEFATEVTEGSEGRGGSRMRWGLLLVFAMLPVTNSTPRGLGFWTEQTRPFFRLRDLRERIEVSEGKTPLHVGQRDRNSFTVFALFGQESVVVAHGSNCAQAD